MRKNACGAEEEHDARQKESEILQRGPRRSLFARPVARRIVHGSTSQ
ncbi:MAG: hypothetical protein MZW92_64935 [Comamonadaceae bacterium]|nr:hypothetical protein [Comamonadaceae bacterium]